MLLPLLLQAALLTQPPKEKLYDDAFWTRWGDSNAELAGYELTMSRYGVPRKGTAVTAYVAETCSAARRVSIPAGTKGKSEQYQVIKLNLVQDFSAGLCDYNLMTSAFVALEPANGRAAGSPAKISFSSQEWSGQIFSQVLFDERSARLQTNSYLDGEGDESRTLETPADAVAEDALLLWARGLAAPRVESGQSASVPCLLSLERTRLQRLPTTVAPVQLTRSKERERLKVPAGEFEVEWASATIENGPVWRFAIETEGQRRVVVWEANDGRRAELLGSHRLRYWELNGPGGESALAKIGLSPRAARTP
jgi:hypothetical protein